MRKKASIFLLAITLPILMNLDSANASLSNKQLKKTALTEKEMVYQEVTDEPAIMNALDLLVGTIGEYSRNALLGNNLSGKPVKILFESPATINPAYASYNALGWKNKNQLYVYINPIHRNAPPEALASLLSHEALHQDASNSINEETYAWTMEAAVWTELTKKNPGIERSMHPLASRENTLRKMFVNANYTNKLIRKIVATNPGYVNLPLASPGFENVDNL